MKTRDEQVLELADIIMPALTYEPAVRRIYTSPEDRAWEQTQQILRIATGIIDAGWMPCSIKPLIFEKKSDGVYAPKTWIAKTPFGYYSLQWISGHWSMRIESSYPSTEGPFKTLEEAQDAAQIDYKKRLLSCLTSKVAAPATKGERG